MEEVDMKILVPQNSLQIKVIIILTMLSFTLVSLGIYKTITYKQQLSYNQQLKTSSLSLIKVIAIRFGYLDSIKTKLHQPPSHTNVRYRTTKRSKM